jgi:ubiquinone/menaquinone biosynthesis C-methylase UbiE
MMGALQFVASQLRKPSGLIGKFVVSRILNTGNARMNQSTLAELDLKPDDTVIEIGFGGGDLINRMASLVTKGRIAGVDFSPEMVALCAKRFAGRIRAGQIELHCASAERLPVGSDYFTKACTVNTIYFWPDAAGPLGELRRVLKPGGRLVVCFNPRATLQKVPFTKYGFRYYEPDDVTDLLRQVGFTSVRTASGTTRLGEFLCAVATK